VGEAHSAAAAAGALLIGGSEAAFHSVDVEVDARGGFHAAYATWADADRRPVAYGYCPPGGACDTRAGWTFAVVAEDTPHVQLRLTPEGRPVLLLGRQVARGVDTELQYVYAACVAERVEVCASFLHPWTTTDLPASLSPWGVNWDEYNAQTFALDSQGRPRVLGTGERPDGGTGSQMFLALCDADCSDAESWRLVWLPVGLQDHHAQLRIGPDDRLHVLGGVTLDDLTEWLAYAECGAGCDEPGDWLGPTRLVPLPSGPGVRDWSLALDPAGRPRIAVQPLASPITYLWCDYEVCAAPGAWFGYDLAFTDGDAYPALALDADGTPWLAFQAASSLVLARCEGECQTGSPRWSAALVDGPEEVAADLAVSVPPTCVRGSWIGGFRPQLSVNARGDLVLGHDAEFLAECRRTPSDPTTTTEATWWTSRVVVVPAATGTPAEPSPGAAVASLGALFPNPARGAVRVPFALAEAADVRLAVLDVLGREVAVLLDGPQPAGPRGVTWDPAGLPAGLYVVRLTTADGSTVRPVTLVR
jgi:hypothetical protein